MGILDDVLRPHLEEVTKTFGENKCMWLSLIEEKKTDDAKSEKEAELNRVKRNDASEDFRNQGNVCFQAKNFCLAQSLYTQSLASAKEGPLASLAYSNRSAALFHMKCYEDSIKDIDRALASEYPNHQKLYRLHLRKAQCLKFLKKDHTGCLADALKAIYLHNNDDAEKLSKLLILKTAELEPVYNVKLINPNNDWKLPELSYGQNPEVPCFSSAVNVKYSKKFKRHLLANRNINTGDALIVEECFTSNMFSVMSMQVCSFCFKFCQSLIPCTKCGDSLYCSEKCRGTDWSREHNGICNKYRPFIKETMELGKDPSEVPPSITVLIHMIARIGEDNIRKIALENKPMLSHMGDPRTKGFHNGKFQEANLEALLSLDDKFYTLPAFARHEASRIAINHCIDMRIPIAELLPVAAILSKLVLIIQNNVMSIFCYHASYESSCNANFLGNSFNLASSFVNHNCNANMFVVSYGSSVVFRALRPIKKGEQLTYMKHAISSRYMKRGKDIDESQIIMCSCSSCVGFDPTSDSLQLFPPLRRQLRWFKAAGCAYRPRAGSKLMPFCNSKIPAPKEILPKLLFLMQCYHESKLKLTRWYLFLQNSIVCSYKAEGSCIFFGDAKEILNGEKEFR